MSEVTNTTITKFKFITTVCQAPKGRADRTGRTSTRLRRLKDVSHAVLKGDLPKWVVFKQTLGGQAVPRRTCDQGRQAGCQTASVGRHTRETQPAAGSHWAS